MTYTVRPISDRTAFTGKQRPSPFDSSWSATEDLLLREVRALSGRQLVLEVDVPESQIRNDGRLYARAVARSSAVRVAFESEHGPLSYATDRFTTWQDNVRAIALSLEALRKVDRYGVTRRGEQYAGFKAIGGGTPMPGPAATPMTSSAASELLRSYAPVGSPLAVCRRAAFRATHPDHGGTRAAFDRVQEACRVLGV